jgi:deoxyribodipyrimidine photolyase-related protein
VRTKNAPKPGRTREGGTLALVFGDQLDAGSPALARLDKARDVVLMAEVRGESTHVPSHAQRTVMFLSAMRHFASDLRDAGFTVRYVSLTDPDNTHHLETEIERAVRELGPEHVICVRPGEWRVLELTRRACASGGVGLDVLEDPHFFTTPADFARWAKGRSSLTMEFFYRQQRRTTGYLMDGDAPEGGEWNYDADNRESFGRRGPPAPIPRPVRFAPDATTRAVIADVKHAIPGLPGLLDVGGAAFGWPVTREQALLALRDFTDHRLALFGRYEDAMWEGEDFVYHSALSPALNLKLVSPRECCDAAVAAFEAGRAPLASVEAFVRQLIGWREFIRGVYWLEGPEYADRNGLGAGLDLPSFYWDAQTDMRCLREAVGSVLRNAYAHHIPRLMVLGNFAMLAGVRPRAVSDWFLGMFADGVDWVTLPNVVGMALHADRRPGAPPGETGLVGTKPYAASANYLSKMGNSCASCRYDPKAREGDDACPFNVLYWDFLIRHRAVLGRNQRMSIIMKNVERMRPEQLVSISVSAERIKRRLVPSDPSPAGAPARTKD